MDDAPSSRSGTWRWLAPPVFEGDEEKTRSAAILNVLLLSALGSQLLTPLQYVAGNHNLVAPLLWVAMALVALALLRLRRVKAASLVAILGSWLILNYVVSKMGGVRAPAFSAHLIIAGSAGILLGWRALLAIIGASVLAGLGLMQLEYNGMLNPNPVPSLLSAWLTYAIIFVIATIELGLAIHIMRQALQRARVELEERTRAEQALRQSEMRFRTLVENAPNAIVVLDCDAERFVEANANAVRLFGYPRERLLNMHPVDLSPETQADGRSSAESAKTYLQQALDGGVPAFDWVHRDANGREIFCEIRVVRMPSATRRLVQGSIVDVSERKRLEAHLLQAQKMESIGHLAGGVAHDFNNLLAVILSSADLLEMKIGDHAAATHIADLRRASTRAAQLTRQLLAFSRKQVMQPTVLNLNAVISDTEKMLRRLIGEHIEVKLELLDDLYSVRADRTQIEQVIVNLVVNARDAMPQGGVLSLRTRNTQLGADAAILAGVQPGNYLLLEVTDTGCGMDAATQARLFEPFFTTKEVGQGTGLGLSTAHGIIKQSGGYITVQSDFGKGSTFRIHLPGTDAKVVPHVTPQRSGVTGRGAETILLAEDNVMILNVAATSLEVYGYKVLRAESPLLALQLAQSYAGPIHLLLTDVIMPGMNGRELAEQVRMVRPEIKLLFTSGYPRDVIVHQGVLDEGIELIEKPFTPDALARRVRGVLNTPSSSLPSSQASSSIVPPRLGNS
jgi:two-component system cell cycle sensor histidine kinase/response regulator CckA